MFINIFVLVLITNLLYLRLELPTLGKIKPLSIKFE